MYALNQDGERTGASISISDRTIFDQLAEGRNRSDYDGSYAITNSHEVGDVYIFAANNTKVEWGLSGYQGKNGRQYVLHTQNINNTVLPRDNSEEGLTIANQYFDMHSHPDHDGTEGGSGYIIGGGDKKFVTNNYQKAKEQGTTPPTYYVYHRQSKIIYQYTPWKSNIYIKK